MDFQLHNIDFYVEDRRRCSEIDLICLHIQPWNDDEIRLELDKIKSGENHLILVFWLCLILVWQVNQMIKC